ncbi:hypothetical protein, partial [Ralstonia chuxiongensis]|uniref:hypothetical protein n=1 Tax=Ralstonia chuxiongensis TaxID=2957504 RepID=UPI002930EA77
NSTRTDTEPYNQHRATPISPNRSRSRNDRSRSPKSADGALVGVDRAILAVFVLELDHTVGFVRILETNRRIDQLFESAANRNTLTGRAALPSGGAKSQAVQFFDCVFVINLEV